MYQREKKGEISFLGEENREQILDKELSV